MLIKKMENLFENKKELAASAGASSILISLLLVLPIIKRILTYSPEIKDFSNHIMSWATASDLNISTRINSYYSLIIGILVMSALLFLITCKMFSGRYNEKSSHLFLYIKHLSFIGIAGVVGSVLSASQDSSLYFLGGAVILGYIYIRFNGTNDFDITNLLWCMLISIPLSLFVTVISNKLHIIEHLLESKFMQKLGIEIDTFYFVFIWFLLCVILLFIFQRVIGLISGQYNITVNDCRNIFILASIPIIFSGIVQSIMLEMLNILNKRFDIVFNKPIVMYSAVIIFALTIMWIISTKLLRQKAGQLKAKTNKTLYNLYIPAILVTFILMIVQPYRMATVGNEYFEMSNHGLSVDHLFRYGSIPLIENFDAHMLSNQIFAYIYSLLNGYEPWGAFLYNGYIQIFGILVMFYLLKSLIGEINSFFFVLTFPLLDYLFSETYLLSGILLFSLYKYFRETHSLKNSFGFWLTAGALCLYRLDLGMAAIIGGLATFLIISFTYKRYSAIFKFLWSGIISGFTAIVLFAMLCLFKGINPKERIIEFIKLCQSNQNWAYANVGDNNLIAYTISYYILPLFIAVIVLYSVLKYSLLKKNLLQVNQQNFIMFIYFSIFFLFNISRGIVRHSLAEGSLIYTVGTFSLAALSFVVMSKNGIDRVGRFLISSIVTVVIININLTDFSGSASIASKALLSKSYQQQYDNSISFDGTRVNGELPSDAQQLKGILDVTLSKDETYFDFSSTNYFYALVGRKNPIYANQSPLMISDDKTQKLALNDIKTKQPPLVLMPIAGKLWSHIDNIAVDFKYYMISEYIYENYEPLIRLSNFDIYSLKSKKETFLSKLEESSVIRNLIYSSDFANANLEGISNHNAITEKENGEFLQVQGTGDDPYIVGQLSSLIGIKSADIKYDASKPTSIKIDFDANKSGNVQLFYTLKSDEDFSEVQSQTYYINSIGKNNMEIHLPSMPFKLRLDINDTDVMLKKLNISQGLEIINEQPEIWTRNIGNIPILWAERDGNENYQNAPYLNKPIINTTYFSLNTQDIIKNQTTYLILQIKSEEDRSASIQLESDGSEEKGIYVFNVLKGSHDYAIRLSTDYKWWNNEIEEIKFLADGAVTINKSSFYMEGQNKFYNTKE